MRGPGMRLKFDVRRLWRCPRCGAERKLPADVTSVRCACASDAPFMQIVELTRRVRPEPKPLNPYLTLDPDAPDEGEGRVSPPPSLATINEPTPGSIATTDAPPPAPSAPRQNRDDRRKPRRDRDRHDKPERSPQNSSAAPPAESPPAMNTPIAAPAPTMPPPESDPTPNPSTEP